MVLVFFRLESLNFVQKDFFLFVWNGVGQIAQLPQNRNFPLAATGTPKPGLSFSFSLSVVRC